MIRLTKYRLTDSVNYCKSIITERVNQSHRPVSRRGIPGKLSEVSIIEIESHWPIVLVPPTNPLVRFDCALPARPERLVGRFQTWPSGQFRKNVFHWEAYFHKLCQILFLSLIEIVRIYLGYACIQ